MRLVTDLLNSLTGNARNADQDGHERGRIERLCRELGWSVAEKDDKKILLNFIDPVAGVRRIWIHGGDGPLVALMVFSFAIVPAQNVPQQVIGHLLRRNYEIPMGAWSVYVDDEDDAMFTVKYCALGAGLNTPMFKQICEQLIAEAVAFDHKMRQAGLLR